ncbi:MAG: ABC transporter substrate-binding protein [Proteobacteria bacterium]|nr:ABC transporter substrate-binding protein [Pseudomonadota bacterium]
MRRKKTIIVLCLLIVSLSGTTLDAKENPSDKSSWKNWGESYFPSKPVRGGVYRMATSRYVGLMNPNHWPVNDWKPINFIYDRLVYINGRYKASIPWLAESWKYTDPLTLVLRLRKGVTFHDGSAYNAESLKYQMEWIKDKKNGAWTRGWLKPMKSIEVMDQYTVRIRSEKPWGNAMGMLNSVPGMVISAKALKGEVAMKNARKLAGRAATALKKAKKAEKKAKSGQKKAMAKAKKARKKADKLKEQARKASEASKGAVNLDIHPVGSGPYTIEEGRPGNYLKLKRNPDWWFGRSLGMPDMPYFDAIKFVVIPDPNIQLANLKSGKVDRMELGLSQHRMVKNDPGLNVFVNPVPHSSFLVFNHAKGPLQDIRVRKAVSHALDRKALVMGTQFGFTQPASGMFPADHWCHNPNLKAVAYNPELSKKLLAEAGYADGLSLKGHAPNNLQSTTVSTAISSMLAKVGIEWRPESLDPAAISDRQKNLDYDLSLSGWVWIHEPDLMPTGMYHPDGGFNYGRSSNSKAVALIEAGRKQVDQAQRQKNYYELEKVLYDNYEDAWLWYGVEIMAFRKKVMGWNNKMYLEDREGFRWTHPLWFKNGKQ